MTSTPTSESALTSVTASTSPPVDPDISADWTVAQDRLDLPAPRRFSPVGQARRLWRWLTSMRTALMLLFLMAVAAIPGSLLPQTTISTDTQQVQQYYVDHPHLAPILDHLGLFNVFSSPWFSAIYLLLFISLVGCVLPRLRVYAIALRRRPPDAPARLERMPRSAGDVRFTGTAAETGAALRGVLRARRYRTVIRTHDDGTVTVSAEKGYLKEAGNLLFHFSLLAVLLGVAFGSWYGWQADRLLVAGADTAFCATPAEFDDMHLGARMTAADLEPFCMQLNSFDVRYAANGQPLDYAAHVSYTLGGGTGTGTPVTIKVNQPLRLPHANVYLVSHGYAMVVKYTDRYGHSSTQIAAFSSIGDSGYTSEGAIAFPDVNVDPATGSTTDPTTFAKQQVGFSGVFLPTASSDGAVSTYPAARNPQLVLTAYIGDLGLDSGVPQSVYTLNQAQIDSGALQVLKPVTNPAMPVRLKPGESAKFADGSSVEFVGTRQWAALTVRDNPGQTVVLAGALLLVIGLVGSLTGRRRRIWFRVRPAEGGCVADAGGLARAEYASFPAEFDGIITAARALPGGTPAPIEPASAAIADEPSGASPHEPATGD